MSVYRPSIIKHIVILFPSARKYIEQLEAEIEGAHKVLDIYKVPREGSYPFANGDGSKTTHSLGGRIARYHAIKEGG